MALSEANVNPDGTNYEDSFWANIKGNTPYYGLDNEYFLTDKRLSFQLGQIETVLRYISQSQNFNLKNWYLRTQ